MPSTLYATSDQALVSANRGYSLTLQNDDTALTIGVPTAPWPGACRGTLTAQRGDGGKLGQLIAGKQLPLRLDCFGTEFNDDNQLPRRKFTGTIEAVTSDSGVNAPGQVIIVITWKDGSKDFLTH